MLALLQVDREETATLLMVGDIDSPSPHSHVIKGMFWSLGW